MKATFGNRSVTGSGRRMRRGVAMFLVIMALGVGVVLSGVMLTRQETTPLVARNALESSESAWSAHAAAEFAEAALQSSEDWVKAAEDLWMLENFQIAGGTVNLRLTNMSGGPPSATDRELRVTATATVGGMTTTVERRVSMVVPTPVEAVVDPHLNEFAIFAKDRLRIESGAVVKQWPLSPELGTLFSVKVGTGFSGASNMELFNGAKTEGVTLYRDANAGETLDSFLDDDEIAGSETIPLKVPAVAEHLPSAFNTLLIANLLDRTLSVSGGFTTLPQGRHQKLTVRNNSRAILDGTASQATYAFTDVDIRDRGAISVRGKARMHVSGSFTVTNLGAIELLTPDAQLEIYVNNGMTIDNSAIGLDRATGQNAARDPDAVSTYRRPDAVRVIAVSTASGGSGSAAIALGGNSICLASIHAPQSTVKLSNGSTLIGRATASSMQAESGTRLYYDPALDSRTGYTELSGPLYEEDGTPTDAVAFALKGVTTASDPIVVTNNVKSAIDTTSWAVKSTTEVVVEETEAVVEDALGLVKDIVIPERSGGGTTPPVTADPTIRHDRRALSVPVANRARGMED
jgi:hypothetical protein